MTTDFIKRHINTTVSNEFYELAKKNNIQFSDALARGIKVLCEGNKEQMENTELRLKIERLATKLYEYNTKTIQLQEEVDAIKASKC